jgi:hypothetical protein
LMSCAEATPIAATAKLAKTVLMNKRFMLSPEC